MNKKTKTKLQFILGGLLFVTFAIAGCNNGDADKDAKKDSSEMKTVPPPPPVRDSMDTGDGKPTPDGN